MCRLLIGRLQASRIWPTHSCPSTRRKIHHSAGRVCEVILRTFCVIPPSAAEGASAATPLPTPPYGADDAGPTPVQTGGEPPRSSAHEASPRAGEQILKQVGAYLFKSLSGSAAAPFKDAVVAAPYRLIVTLTYERLGS